MSEPTDTFKLGDLDITLDRTVGGGQTLMTVRHDIPIDKATGKPVANGARKAMQAIQDPALRGVLFAKAADFGLAGQGVSGGGLTPVFKNPSDRNTLCAYETRFKWVKSM